ncbi:MAG: hypothetical protein LH632_02410 [Rhodoferax sp.]|nr:hypothetical protein [Rhodoferax sp.]
MFELERRRAEKRARREMTRPEPTIIGNCDSWNFIVGKKARQQSLTRVNSSRCKSATIILYTGYSQLLTKLSEHLVGDLWIIRNRAKETPYRGPTAIPYVQIEQHRDPILTKLTLAAVQS